ncbi:MAG: hypothetical protein HEP71_25265 [Roseivirga sp.]|nr:hypothetical protein [Roseivirga sp.]
MQKSKAYHEALSLFQDGKKAKGHEKQPHFEACFQLLMTCEGEEVAEFVIQTECHHKHASRFFWASELPDTFKESLFSKANAAQMLRQYFKHPGSLEHISESLIKYLAQTYQREFVIVVRETQSFLVPPHLKSFLRFKGLTNEVVRRAIVEWEYIDNFKKAFSKKSLYFDGLIRDFSFEELLIHFTAANERQKRRDRTGMNNAAYKVGRETNLLRVMNRVLQLKQKQEEDTGQRATGEEQFLKQLADALPPQNTPEALADPRMLPEEELTEEKKLFTELIDFYFKLHEFEHYIDMYSYGYAEVEMLDSDEIQWKSTAAFVHHKRNDHKKKYAEGYMINRAALKSGARESSMSVGQFKVSLAVAKSKVYYKTLFLPLEARYNDTIIDLSKVFLLLASFSEYLMPAGNQWVAVGDSVTKLPDVSAKHPLLPEDYLVRLDHQSMLEVISEVFGWEEQEVVQIVDFLTSYLDRSDAEIDLWTRPLVRHGSHVYWCSTYLRDRDWPVLIQGRGAREQLNKKQKESDEQLEEDLANLFIDAGFEAVASRVYEIDKQTKPEIDVLAYADNTLFIIELKTTYLTEDPLRNLQYINRTYAEKAVDQLKRSKTFIEANFDGEKFRELKTELGITCSLEELSIRPLIVSNVFDGDDLVFDEEIMKISAFELSIILENDLFWVLNISVKVSGQEEIPGLESMSIYAHEQMQNQNAKGFRNEPIDSSKEACDLWSSKDSCSADDLITAIEQDKVWSFLDELWDFSVHLETVFRSTAPN